ncbi:MAG: bacillithiol biosynthesis deacetylase BshB1 [Acidobacteriota bacterium]
MSDQYGEFTEVDVLALGAHPDDVELGCAGTLLSLKSQGQRIAVADMTRGEMGSRGSVEIRAREASEASRILGLEYRTNLELEDANILVNQENRRKLVRILRQCRPRLVITHSRGGHPDHGKTAALVEEAVHHAGLARIETGQPRFRPEQIAYWIVFNQIHTPQVIVDISVHYEQKERAIRAYASQLHDPSAGEPEIYLSRAEFLDQLRSFQIHLGSLAGCFQGEGFLLSRLPRIQDLSLC